MCCGLKVGNDMRGCGGNEMNRVQVRNGITRHVAPVREGYRKEKPIVKTSSQRTKEDLRNLPGLKA